jgi:hypothetical protein
MPPSPQFHPKADVREDVPVGAQGCEDGMYGEQLGKPSLCFRPMQT